MSIGLRAEYPLAFRPARANRAHSQPTCTINGYVYSPLRQPTQNREDRQTNSLALRVSLDIGLVDWDSRDGVSRFHNYAR